MSTFFMDGIKLEFKLRIYCSVVFAEGKQIVIIGPQTFSRGWMNGGPFIIVYLEFEYFGIKQIFNIYSFLHNLTDIFVE